ncbi:MAG: tetratricopeptide repeat protein [Nostocales cyanobacterium]|nr:MAG: tetratricopeptide repeat protein [Nostocales cyanobacterium]
MDWTNILKAQQTDFIARIKSGDLLHCEKEGQHSELTVISGERLKQLRDFCWEMAEKYRRTSTPIRDVFINNLKGKLGEEVVKSRLGNFVTEVDYEKRKGGDGKVDFTLTSDSSIGIQVKTRYGNCDQVQWTIDREEIEKNSVLVCVLCQEEFSETEKEYRFIMAGFLPTNMIKSTGDKTLVGIDELLYPGSLRGYLDSLITHKVEEYIRLGIECFYGADDEGFISNFNQALQLNPNNADIYYELGDIFLDLGNFIRAIEDYTQAIKIDRNFSKAYNYRGIARSQLGDKQGAIADFKQAADLFYEQGDQKFYKYALDKIRELELQEDNKSQKQLPQPWNIGDRVIHKEFGGGQVTHIFELGKRISLAIRFNELGQKIIDPTIAQLVKID